MSSDPGNDRKRKEDVDCMVDVPDKPGHDGCGEEWASAGTSKRAARWVGSRPAPG